MTIQEGGCLCGALRFKVEGEPMISGACYCRHCQHVAGGGGAFGVLYPVEALTVTAGETRAFLIEAESGAEVVRQFCPDCGVHLFAQNSRNPQVISVKIGAFDDPGWFRSQGSIWTASAQPWHRVDPDLPSWEGDPEIEV